MRNLIDAALHEAAAALDRLRADDVMLARIETAAAAMAASLKAGGRIISAGNGGSMCDAMHFAQELAGRYRNDRPGLAAMAISDPSYLSCAANDLGYESIFARYLEAHARRGDVFLAFSTSGNSPNMVRAAETARSLGVSVVAMTGRAGSRLAGLADIEILTPAGKYADRIQELHIKVVHILIELVEHQLFGRPA